ncbi:MAG: glycerophosphodiester phosphodiesterase family protein [Ginsengibacter sp.]
MSILVYSQKSISSKTDYYLIAHRGGVVDSTITDNSRTAIETAIKRGYDMVEVDLRLTRDSVLIIQHDPTFKRYYRVDKPVSSMTWKQVSQLRSSIAGDRVLRFEEVLKICKGRIQIMIDNKIQGMDSGIFTRVISLLRNYDLLNQALMIGTTASTPFFTGKIKLSCTRKQVKSNMKQQGYSPANYYIFEIPENIPAHDVKWAKAHDIQIVAAINKFRYSHSSDPLKEAADDINRMINEGITHFQIDSEFDASFFH